MHLLMGHTLYFTFWVSWDFSTVIGLEAERGGEVGPEDTWHFVAWQLPQGRPSWFLQTVQNEVERSILL